MTPVFSLRAWRPRLPHPAWLALGVLLLASPLVRAQAFDFETLTRLARERAQAAYRGGGDKLPSELARLDYDQYRDIRFRPAQALWRDAGLPFETQFFHLGRTQAEPVRVNEITPQGVQHIRYDRRAFDYGKNRLEPQAWGDLGFAGLRVHYPLNSPDYKDELIVFLGASYFRALGAGQQYGLSARGLAIDTAGGSGEEFPRFTEFWLERPAPGARQLTLYALLDSPRASGAYRFDIVPGPQSTVTVRARVFLRAGAGRPVATLGLAPLTSMFLSGENQPRPGDFRPEVHDSDGLMVATGDGEWLWRPLQNPRKPLVTSFAMNRLAGFGLMQRDRAFASYEDVEARYERRPSAWVRPLGDWGPGRVELVQLPTPDETHDNIVAYWVPAQWPAPGAPLEFAYELGWQGDAQQRPPAGWVTQSRRGIGYSPLSADELKTQVQYVVDFTGPALDALAPEAPVQAVATSDAGGRIVEQHLYRNPATGAWRLTLRVQRNTPAQPIELRAFLQHHNEAVSETWSNILLPD
ncbi:glucan biosynthesis protein G [Variovorax terrae]|uniref:Glucans biosynthesis protein G n=1 Tax=Variovorax terrae TaxID=2923278 RepID=A0A9X1VQN0_9BURK|nr:glucan biosynthesis protein G [Variovorax terrae]MCJ0762026.1 glucan biosynthesis protein G [Variovorax terrae]